MAARQLAIVALYAAHDGEVFASPSVQCAISSLNSVDAKSKQRNQEDKATALTEVGPAATFNLGAISEMPSLVMSRAIIFGHSSYYLNDLQGLLSRFG